MTRRELLGAAAAILVLAVGRLIRRRLLLDPDGSWREPGWLEAHLPPLPAAEVPAARSGPRRPSGLLDPNTCPADSLELLPGVGPALAGRIMAARAEGVHFACARDLQEIRGIGPQLAARLQPYLVFAGADSVAAPDRQSASPARR